jgi:hypothetical protein
MPTPRQPQDELPELNEGLLDDETLEQYFRDLEQTNVFGVLVKGAPRHYADTRNLELSTARHLFEDGLAHGLQIRYLWNGEEWWDTIFRTQTGVRLVRIRHEWDD